MNREIFLTQRRLFVLLLIGLFVLMFFILRPFLMPLVVGSVIVLLFYPIYDRLLKIFKSAYLTSFLVTLLVILFIFVPVTVIGSLVTKELSLIVEKQLLPFLDRGDFANILRKWNVDLQAYLTQLEAMLQTEINLKGMISNTIKQSAQYISRYSPMVVAQTVSFVVQSFIALFVVFFLFVEGKRVYEEMKILSPLKEAHENAFAYEIRVMLHSIVYGSFVTALVQGILAGIGFYLLNIQGALVWGVLTSLFAFIPLMGAGVVWMVAALILFLTGQTKSALILTVYGGVVISGIDNILKPLLIGGKNKIHPLLLFLSIIGSIILVGPIGILLGPVCMAVLMAALKIYKQEYLY